MLESAVSAAMLFFTYFLAPVSVATVAARRLGDRSDNNQFAIFLACLGVGPLAVAWCLELLLRIVPGLQNYSYIGSVGAMFLPVMVSAFRSRSVFLDMFQQAKNQWRVPRAEILVASFFIFGAIWNFSYAFYLSLQSYYTGGDALEYGRMAQLIYEHKSAGIYPFFGDNGIPEYFASAHPMAYHLLIVWSFLINGSHEFFGYARLINPVLGLCTAALLWGAFAKKRIIYGALAAFFLSMSPNYMDLIWNKHIDIIRTYGFALAVFGTCLFAERLTRKNAVLFGAGLGTSLYTHALGILTPLVALAVLAVLTRPRLILSNWRAIALAFLIAAVFGGGQYSRNTMKFGTPVSNTTPVWELDSVRYAESVTVLRRIQTTEEKVKNGLFGAFTKPDRYSYIFWMLPVGLLLHLFRRIEDCWTKSCLLACGAFFGIMLLSMLNGSITLIMNGRYILGLQPLAASVAAFCLGRYYESRPVIG
jgi:hypothetical protein